MTNTLRPSRTDKLWLSQRGAVFAVLAISLIATLLIWKYESQRVQQLRQLQFERSSQLLKDNIVDTMTAYAQFLRNSVGLVHSSDEVRRSEWRQYVSDARLSENYPGIQGVGINGFVTNDAELQQLVARVRSGDWPTYEIKPEGAREAYAPVLYLEPQSESNERAIGFDIYSESRRRAAVDRAVATGEPTLTEKITLVQENGSEGAAGVQAGLLLVLPTYKDGVLPASASDRRAQASGLIVSVFRMGDLIDSVYAARGETPHQRIRLHLYDADTNRSEMQLFGDTFDAELDDHDALFRSSVTETAFGRPWTFQMASALAFERETASSSPSIVLGAGVLLSMLLTSLVWGQSQRARETEVTALELTSNQRHIEFLMGEVNHRSKNLLGLVQAIARQTKADDPRQFVSQFSERVRALAANQDLLVRNGWKGISMNDLIDSQLSHFEGLLGTRILLNGPDIDINAEASQTLGMAFHELATNAGKYGALSNPSGTVDIEWQIVRDDGAQERLEIGWLESGGPPVVAPSRKGFGTKVTDMMAKYSLEGTVESLYEPTGFVWRLSCPTHKIFEDDAIYTGTVSKDYETTE